MKQYNNKHPKYSTSFSQKPRQQNKLLQKLCMSNSTLVLLVPYQIVTRLLVLLSVIQYSMQATFIHNDHRLSRVAIKAFSASSNVIQIPQSMTSTQSITFNINIKQNNQVSIFDLFHKNHLKLELAINITNGVDEFHEVVQPYDDNRFVHESHVNSDVFRLKEPLRYLTDNYCRHPIPREYLIVIERYKDHYSQGHPQNLDTQCKNLFDDCTKYVRSINKRCPWNKETNFQPELNSVYRTESSESAALLKLFFNETQLNRLRKQVEFTSSPHCERLKARCIDCQFLECGDKRQYCCQTKAKCLRKPECTSYYNNITCSVNYRQSTISKCMKGTTFKFTLNPNFDIDFRRFTCQFKKIPNNVKIKLRMSLRSTNYVLPYLEDISARMQLSPNSPYSIINNLMFNFSTGIDVNSAPFILVRSNYNYYLYPLRKENRFLTTDPIVEDIPMRSYVRVQFRQPFLLNTETWARDVKRIIEESDQRNIFSSQTPYEPGGSQRIRVVPTTQPTLHQDSSNNDQLFFKYYLIPQNSRYSNKLQISSQRNTSLLSLYFCHSAIKSYGSPESLKISVVNIDQFTWIITLKGWVKGKVSYVTLTIDFYNELDTQFNKTNIITHYQSDLLIYSLSGAIDSFNISHEIKKFKSTNQTAINRIIITIHHCQQKLLKKTIYLSSNTPVMFIEKSNQYTKFIDISNFVLILFLSSISISFVYFILISVYAIKKSRKSASSSSSSLSSSRKMDYNFSVKENRCKIQNEKINKIIILKIILFLTFKLFFTFSFTFSLILSVCLSLEVFRIDYFNSKYHLNLSLSTIDEKSQQNMALKKEKSKHCLKVDRSNQNESINKLIELINNHEYVRSQSKQAISNVTTDGLISRFNISSSSDWSAVWVNYNQNIINEFKISYANYADLIKNSGESLWFQANRRLGGFKINNAPYLSNVYVQLCQFPNAYKPDKYLYLDSFATYSLFINCQNLFVRLQNFTVSQTNIKVPKFHKKFQLHPTLRTKLLRLYDNINDQSNDKRIRKSKWKIRHRQQKYLSILIGRNYVTTTSTFSSWSAESNKSFISVTHIRLLFLVLDAILIAYRCYWAYIDFQGLWNSGQVSNSVRGKKLFFKPSSHWSWHPMSDQQRQQQQQQHQQQTANSNTTAKTAILRHISPAPLSSWTKRHHLDCFTSGHIAIASAIILVAVVCIQILVLLSSRNHAAWLIKSTLAWLRYSANYREEVRYINTVGLTEKVRVWARLDANRLEQMSQLRRRSFSALIHFEIFLNQHYINELCFLSKNIYPNTTQHVNKGTTQSRSMNYCQFTSPKDTVQPPPGCEKYFEPSIFLTSLSNQRFQPSALLVNIIRQLLTISVNLLAITLLILAVIGLINVTRKLYAISKSKSDSTGKVISFIIKTSENKNTQHQQTSTNLSTPRRPDFITLTSINSSDCNDDQIDKQFSYSCVQFRTNSTPDYTNTFESVSTRV